MSVIRSFVPPVTPGEVEEMARVEREEHPRWVWWPGAPPRALVASGVRPARCWDLGAVHRLLVGGWSATPTAIWAACHGLEPADARATMVVPSALTQPDLFTPETIAPDERELAAMALECHDAQLAMLAELADPATALRTAYSESAAELLCAELEHDGLPIDVTVAEEIIGGFVGPRPATAAEAAAQTAARDALVLRHVPADQRLDLRNPANVKALLRRVGVEVPDTRAGRLERLRDAHPLVDDLLVWRKAERIATTFGYAWLDANVGHDGRLRGQWSGSDGAAGRMTATAGLHNMPADLRPAIVAEAGFVFVRADLGQIEPRVLAAVSADPALAAATHNDDMYAPVAARLGVTRDIAKVAVLGAMYGQTTGRGAEALRGLAANFPVAMAYLSDAAHKAEGGHDLRTRGGRLVRMGTTAGDDESARSRAAARGRYGRNAMVQGAAAEFFKTWAVIVRARLAERDAGSHIVLCLHDELLLHVPAAHGADVARLVDECLHEAAHRWLDATAVRLVADISVIHRWSDAK